MIKTNIDKIAMPDIALIIKGVLKGYLDDVDSFMDTVTQEMVRTASSVTQKNPTAPTAFVNLVSLISALYFKLKEREASTKALDIVMAAFLPAGLALQMGNFRFVEDEHTFGNLIKYQQRTNKEGPTKLNRMEIIRQDDAVYEFHVHNCMFRDVFSNLGIPELTSVMCAIDNVAFNAYLPDQVHFHRNGMNNSINRGNDFCTFICENRV